MADVDSIYIKRSFDFPRGSKKEAINIKVVSRYAAKVRSLSKVYDCSMSEVFETLIVEGIKEYESRFGKIPERPAIPNFSPSRDYVIAGDGRRDEFTTKISSSTGRIRTCRGEYCKKPNNKFREDDLTRMITIGRESYVFCSDDCLNKYINMNKTKNAPVLEI